MHCIAYIITRRKSYLPTSVINSSETTSCSPLLVDKLCYHFYIICEWDYRICWYDNLCSCFKLSARDA